jgi:hypothetical protein
MLGRSVGLVIYPSPFFPIVKQGETHFSRQWHSRCLMKIVASNVAPAWVARHVPERLEETPHGFVAVCARETE